MIILRKFWADRDNEKEFVIITNDGDYHALTKDEAFIVLKQSLEIVSQLQPLLFSKGLDFYSSDN